MGRKLKFHCSSCDGSTSSVHGLYNSNLNLHTVHLHITYFIAFGFLLLLSLTEDFASFTKIS